MFLLPYELVFRLSTSVKYKYQKVKRQFDAYIWGSQRSEFRRWLSVLLKQRHGDGWALPIADDWFGGRAQGEFVPSC